MVRNFKGVVKVEDVKEEFDNLLETINAKIDTYNDALQIEDVDYNNGGSDLAAYGYTLSVGGLKTVLDAYDGAILGANVLRISNNQYVVSEGLYITSEGVKRLPSKVLSGDGNKIYFDETTNRYTFDSAGAGKLYPDAENNDEILFPVGTYPALIVTHDGEQVVETESTVSFEEDTEVRHALTNSSTNNMQTSACNMTVYTSYPDKYDWNSLSPSILLDSTAPQQHDIYLDSVTTVFDANRAYTEGTIPMNTNFGSQFVFGLKMEFNFTETPAADQSFTMTVHPSGYGEGYYESFEYWKFQAFAYDAGGNLLKTGSISTGSPYYSGCSLSEVPSGTRKIIVCALVQEYNGWLVDKIGNLYSGPAYIKISNTTRIDYVNVDVDCQLTVYRDGLNPDMYSVNSYMGGQATLLGSAHFTANTDTLEYIQLSQGGGSGTGNIPISAINPNRISRLCNKPNAVNEEIPDYKMTIESKNSGYTYNGNQYLSNSEKGQFYSGSAGRNCAIKLFDTQVAYHHWGNDRSDSYHEPLNFMFIPKGIPNPYNSLSGETVFAMQKVWNYILKRPER